MTPYLTEEEAKTKLCHVALASNGTTTTLCAASACMAWRRREYGRVVERKKFTTVAEADAFLRTAAGEWESRSDAPTIVRCVPVGYCGRVPE